MLITATLHGLPTNLAPWVMDGFSPLTVLESPGDQSNMIRDLQRRIEALENRIRDMEKNRGSPNK